MRDRRHRDSLKPVRSLLLAALLILPCAGASGTVSLLGGLNPALNAALWQAAGRGEVARVRDLVRRGASPNARNKDGRTALTNAALGDHVTVARLLITAGANPDPQDKTRNNALLVTGETGSVAMLREVLRAEPDLTRTNRFGGTALIPAADRGHVEYVRERLCCLTSYRLGFEGEKHVLKGV